MIHRSYKLFIAHLEESADNTGREGYDWQFIQEKVKYVKVWVSLNKPFYARLIPHVTISGSLDIGETMATDGRNIYYHPDFILNQSVGALALVFSHELLHCIQWHHKSRGTRDPELWNIACDYAINPILNGEPGFEWPVDEDGKRMGLLNEEYFGMSAEAIYEKLRLLPPQVIVNLGRMQIGGVLDSNARPRTIPQLTDGQQQGKSGEGQGKPSEGHGKPGEGHGKPGEGQGKPNEDRDGGPTSGPGYGTETTLPDIAAAKQVGQMGVEPKEAMGGGPMPEEIDWDRVVAAAAGEMKKHMTEAGMRILLQLSKKPALIDWKKYIRKFVDRTMNSEDDVIPKRRFAGSGIHLTGQKAVDPDGFKTVVLACDTSGSITKNQTKSFIIEAINICNDFSIDRLIILYCSDKVNNVDDVNLSRKQKPDFAKWRSTGGNLGGFSHPFNWLSKNKIVPSFLIYFTDGQSNFPELDTHTKKYKDRVMWFILGNFSRGAESVYGGPKFGKVFEMLMQDMPGTD